MAQRRTTKSDVERDENDVLLATVKVEGFPITVYPPSEADRKRGKAYHRIKWTEHGRVSHTTGGPTWAVASKKVEDIAKRLKHDADKGDQLVSAMAAEYIDAKRPRGRRGKPWSAKHQDTQARLVNKYVVAKIGRVRCQHLASRDLQAVLDAGPKTLGERQRLLKTLRALVKDGWEQHYLVRRPDDLLRGLTINIEATEEDDDAIVQGVHVLHVEAEAIPSHEDVAKFAKAAAAEPDAPWWFELMPYVAAYSGVRLGELLALTGADVTTRPHRVIRVEWQITEVAGKPQPKSRPKGRKRRRTTFPDRTPATTVYPEGYPLAEMLHKRLAEVTKEERLFPTPAGGHWYRSNFSRRYFARAARAAEWPTHDDGSWVWTWHSLRHVFCTYYLWERKSSPPDVSTAAGHSTVSTTLNLYANLVDGALERLEPEATD